MLDKGYDFLFDDDDTNYQPIKKGEWFEVIYTKILPIYKRAILKYPKDHYTYLQLQWTGQGFALGLTKNIEENYWEYITDETFDESDCSLNDVYHILEAIPYEDDEGYLLDIERQEWPKNEQEIYDLEYFMLYTMLALMCQELMADAELQPYLSNIKKRVIVATDRPLQPFKYLAASIKERKKMVTLLIKEEATKLLILDLWADQLKDKGAQLLERFK